MPNLPMESLELSMLTNTKVVEGNLTKLMTSQSQSLLALNQLKESLYVFANTVFDYNQPPENAAIEQENPKSLPTLGMVPSLLCTQKNINTLVTDTQDIVNFLHTEK